MFVQDMRLAKPSRTACLQQQQAKNAHDEGTKCFLSVSAIIPREKMDKVSQMDLNAAFAQHLPVCDDYSGVQAKVSLCTVSSY